MSGKDEGQKTGTTASRKERRNETPPEILLTLGQLSGTENTSTTFFFEWSKDLNVKHYGAHNRDGPIVGFTGVHDVADNALILPSRNQRSTPHIDEKLVHQSLVTSMHSGLGALFGTADSVDNFTSFVFSQRGFSIDVIGFRIPHVCQRSVSSCVCLHVQELVDPVMPCR